jgi:hypothetical protein
VAINHGITNSLWTFYVDGTSAGNTGWAISSDERLKTNIRDVSDGLSMIMLLRPVRFDWKAPAARAIGKKMNLEQGRPQIGFLAQDVEKVIPEAVIKPATPDQAYSFVPTDIIPVLVQAVKEQQAEIKDLQNQILLLKGQK